jgi:hypothetical protein
LLLPELLRLDAFLRPELSLYAEVVLDAVRLVRGTRLVATTKPAEVAAARHWIVAGNVGALTFKEACAWLGWDAEHVVFDDTASGREGRPSAA